MDALHRSHASTSTARAYGTPCHSSRRASARAASSFQRQVANREMQETSGPLTQGAGPLLSSTRRGWRAHVARLQAPSEADAPRFRQGDGGARRSALGYYE
jgi:hypothetical protein